MAKRRSTDNAAHDGEWLNTPLLMSHTEHQREQMEIGGGVSIVPSCFCWPEPVAKDGNKEFYLHIHAEAEHALRN